MRIPVYQVDAFSRKPFAGNPAAVCPLGEWLPDELMQSIAAEKNLSETAFLVGGGGRYRIRWFTPEVEVDLCGHATLASAWVVFNVLERGRGEVRFDSRSGELVVTAQDDLLRLDFPSRPPQPREGLDAVADALGARPTELLGARDLMAVFATEEQVRGLRPDMAKVASLPTFALIVTAPGRDCDFVSRFFAPAKGVAEDPVTGSAHCTLIPFWAARLGKKTLSARQVSARGGELVCELAGERVGIAGPAAPFLQGTIEV
jgi:PhzF family phenazine biosynthesis protein